MRSILPFLLALTTGAPQLPAPPADPLEAWTWVEGRKGEHWYALTTEATDHVTAEGQALLVGGHLVTVDDEREAEWLLETFGGDPLVADGLWLGLRRRHAGEELAWTSGAPGLEAPWSPAATPERDAATGVALLVRGPAAGTWRDRRSGERPLFGVIEVDFDPAEDPLEPDTRALEKRVARWFEARAACLAAAERDAEQLGLEAAREELAALRAAKAAIIHAQPRPTSAETVAASDAVQDWVDARLETWRKRSTRLRKGLAALEKADAALPADVPYALGQRALRTDLLCTILDAESGAEALEVRLQNRRAAARAGLSREHVEIVVGTNEHRRLMGVGPLRLDGRITYAAQVHADDMAALGFFAHQSPVPGRRDFSDRQAEAGYVGGGGENLYQGRSPGTGAVEGWIGSPGHHSNMLQPGHGLIGPGVSAGYGVEVFGARPRR